MLVQIAAGKHMSSDSDIPESVHLKNYRDLIRRMVNEQPDTISTPPDVLRPSPQHPSTYYDGTNDRAAFDRWLRALLLYFRASMMCGEVYDDLRVTTAAGYLEGIARDWFFARVAAPGSSVPYKFEEVVIGMVRVFVTFESPGWSSPPNYTPGTTARAFHFQLQYWNETNNPTPTEAQGDALIRHTFLQWMRKAMLEMYPGEDRFITGWYTECDRDSKEIMLDQTQSTLDWLREKKQEDQERKDGRDRR